MSHKTTPGSLHLTHRVLSHGEYTGDENLHLDTAITIQDNYVYINGINTGINVKGDPGPTGPSAYDSYVEYCTNNSITPLSEEAWVEQILARTQANWQTINTADPSYILNKPLDVTVDTGTNTIDVFFNE